MKFSAQKITGFLATLFLATQTFANTNASVNTTTSTTVAQAPAPIFSGVIQGSRSTSLIDFKDGSRKDGMDYSTSLKMKLNKDFSLRLDAGYSQDLVDPQGDDFSDLSLSLGRAPVEFGKLILLGYGASVAVPVSKASRIGQNLKTSLSGSLGLSINPDRLIQGLSLGGGLSIRRNFHEYDTALSGPVLTQYSSSQTISVSYAWTSGLSLSGDFAHKNGLTYQNNLKEAFEHTEELGYSINEALAVAIGHTNSGSVFKANGIDSNIGLIDENNSLVYASLTVAF